MARGGINLRWRQLEGGAHGEEDGAVEDASEARRHRRTALAERAWEFGRAFISSEDTM